MNWWGKKNPESSKFDTNVLWEPYLEEDPHGRSSEPRQEQVESFRYVFSHNYPNPFNPTTTLRYGLAEPGRVAIRIYDVSGRLVRTLVDAEQPAGYYVALWNGLNDSGQKAASGVYFCRMESAHFREIRKLVLLK
jgi:hypothetical protein